MEESLKFNSQICTTKEQSQRLLDLGLKPETADMYHTTFYRDNVGYEILQVRNEKLPLLSQEIPAWSLHRLLCLLYPREDVYPIMPTMAYDDIIDEIGNEIKCGGFNKEYLKQCQTKGNTEII